jgi:hypothetical protein
MGKNFMYFLSFVLFMALLSCASNKPLNQTPSVTRSVPRTIILDGDTISEKVYGEFKSWYCKDYIDGGSILVEVGTFSNPIYKNYGFILFDRGSTGSSTRYHLDGLDHRWDWGPNNNDYTFLIKQDGKGLYYNFRNVAVGGSAKASDVYRCYSKKQ